MLIEAIGNTWANLTVPEQFSLKKVIRNVTGAFQTCFGDWTVGIGMEEQVRSFVLCYTMTSVGTLL